MQSQYNQTLALLLHIVLYCTLPTVVLAMSFLNMSKMGAVTVVDGNCFHSFKVDGTYV